jgi:hypothetical protein
MVKQLEEKDVDFEDLKKNLDYTASLLEAVYFDGTRYSVAFSVIILYDTVSSYCLLKAWNAYTNQLYQHILVSTLNTMLHIMCCLYLIFEP